MPRLGAAVWAWTLAAFVASTFTAATAAESTVDLSRYRIFQLGSDLASVAKQVSLNPSQAKGVHLRPALIQELEWRPHTLGPSVPTEPAKDVIFTFYEGRLFRIAVAYDRYQTEGLTADDLVEAISATYGIAARATVPAKAGLYGDREEVLARWEDSKYRFSLTRSSYGSEFKLVGVFKELEAPAEVATLEAKRLDDQEAPQRDAARMATEEAAATAQLEKARLVNKPKFRP